MLLFSLNILTIFWVSPATPEFFKVPAVQWQNFFSQMAKILRLIFKYWTIHVVFQIFWCPGSNDLIIVQLWNGECLLLTGMYLLVLICVPQ